MKLCNCAKCDCPMPVETEPGRDDMFCGACRIGRHELESGASTNQGAVISFAAVAMVDPGGNHARTT